MLFREGAARLQCVFDANGFSELAANKHYNSRSYVIETLTTGALISVSYPGLKSKVGRRVIYDYRVDFRKDGIACSLSHANIITDIYNKCAHGGVEPRLMKEFLSEISKEELTPPERIFLLQGRPARPPGTDLLELIEQAHRRLDKRYDRRGSRWDFTFEELAAVIRWIAIQEDINYPPQGRIQGRKMPFARYMEAVWCAAGERHHITEVIERALAHYIPLQWPNEDYSFLDDITY